MAEQATEAAPETPTATPEPSIEPEATPTPEPAPAEPTSEPEPQTIATREPEDRPTASPATWPDDWRERFAGNDENHLKTLKRFTDPANVFKSYMSLRAKMGTDYMPKRPDTDDEEKLAAWRSEVGVPDSPEGYLEALPRELQIDEQDKAFVDHYFQKMHARGVPPADVAEGLQSYYEMKAAEAEEILAEDQANRNVVEDELRAEWGPDYRGNLNAIHAVMGSLGNEELITTLFEARTPGGRPLGDDPNLLRFLARTAKEMGYDGTVTPVSGADQGQNVQDEIASLEAEMGQTRPADGNHYWNNPAKQERLRQLYAMQEKIAMRGR